MSYKLGQDYFAENDRGLAIIYTGPAFKYAIVTKDTLLGTFKESDGEFYQNDGINLDLEDCREVVRIAEQIKNIGFDKLYNEAEPNKDENE